MQRSAAQIRKQVEAKQEDNDESFFDLLNTFAKLDLPDSETSTIEKCPLCPAELPIADFAGHVYECIKSLDGEEKKFQEDRDAELAKQLSRGQGREGLYLPCLSPP